MTLPVDTAARRKYVRDVLLPRQDLRPFINGKFVTAHGRKTLDVIDPMTETPLVTMPLADEVDASQALAAARSAFDNGPWRHTHPRDRARYLLTLAALIEENLDEIALLEAIDTGKRLTGICNWDIPNAAEVLRYYAGWADKVEGRTLPDAGSVRVNTYREPVGVCVAIMPWNFPFACLAWKVAPALAAGCTMVVKTAERAPLSSQMFAHLVEEAEFPPGVVNILLGEGVTVGSTLAQDERVDKVTFTGGTSTARSIIAGTAGNLARLSLELGGKNPNVVMDDADLDSAVSGTVAAMFSVAGQDCGAGSRTLVHTSIYDQFVRELAKQVSARKLGDPLDDRTEQGPQIDRKHLERIHSYVMQAIKDGASLLTGGAPSPVGPLFYAPTVLENVTSEMPVTGEEIFGPVGCLYRFDDLDAAIGLANDTCYGLAAAIWTNRVADSERFVREVRAGTCWVNCHGYFDTVAPWGGRKQSGYGRELGREGIEAFLETKTVFRA
jgi:aldehyde dehydrogenase (NAD+)